MTNSITPPILSFYMTVKNGLPTIKEALRSIQQQTFSDFETIIVDDGSTDGTVDYLKWFTNQDPRFKIMLTPGLGRGAALNLALSQANGMYVANLDADDYAHPQRAEIQLNFLSENQKEFCVGLNTLVYEDENPRFSIMNTKMHSIVSRDVRKHLAYRNPVCHSAITVKRTLLQSLGGYDQSRESQFDYDLWIRVAAAGVSLNQINVIVCAKRIHHRQSFENKNRFKYLRSSVKLQREAISKLQFSPLYHILPIARLIYGSLPQRLRAKLRSMHRPTE